MKQDRMDKKSTGFHKGCRNAILQINSQPVEKNRSRIKIICFFVLLLFLSGCSASEKIPGQEKNMVSGSEEKEPEVFNQENDEQAFEGNKTETSAFLFEEYLENGTNMQKLYSEILLYPENYPEYFAVTEQIPSENKWKLEELDGTKPYCFAIQDINQDGVEELLLGYGLQYTEPQLLLNILQYDQKKEKVIDLDGRRTYPIMDSLLFYANGYFVTQNGVSDLYTECWRIKDKPDHYWFGWERTAEFQDTDGRMMQAEEYYTMIGESVLDVKWREITKENMME